MASSENLPLSSGLITVITPDDIRAWLSLTEAMETLVEFWKAYSSDVRIKSVSTLSASDMKEAALESRCVVIGKITPTTAQVIKNLRTLNADLPMVFHAFETPSVWFANTFLFELDSFLRSGDLWITSCEADAQLARVSAPKINVAVVPLRSTEKSIGVSSCQHLYYFGRFSEQKNLECSLFAVSLLAEEMRKEQRKLFLIGYEDFLGVPHLRIPSFGYVEHLYSIVKDLGIGDLVEFQNPVSVEEMEKLLSQGIFVSPSIHSDENFGLVAFRALSHGVPCVLSSWGGHKDLAEKFSGVSLVPVQLTETGPRVNPYDLASEIRKLWKTKLAASALAPQNKALSLPVSSGEKMEFSTRRNEVVSRIRGSYPKITRKWPLYGQLYQSYNDQIYRDFCRVYGAQDLPPLPEDLVLSPEIEITQFFIKSKDCRSRNLSYSRVNTQQTIQLSLFNTARKVSVSEDERDWLWQNGYVFKKDLYEL